MCMISQIIGFEKEHEQQQKDEFGSDNEAQARCALTIIYPHISYSTILILPSFPTSYLYVLGKSPHFLTSWKNWWSLLRLAESMNRRPPPVSGNFIARCLCPEIWSLLYCRFGKTQFETILCLFCLGCLEKSTELVSMSAGQSMHQRTWQWPRA